MPCNTALWCQTHFGVGPQSASRARTLGSNFDPKVRYTDTYAISNIRQTTALWGHKNLTNKNEF